MRRILLVIAIILIASNALAGPAPMTKQLNIGKFSYFPDWRGSWPYPTGTPLQAWVANHYSWFTTEAGIDDSATYKNIIGWMNGVNPGLQSMFYVNYMPFVDKGASKYIIDQTDLKMACDSLGFIYDNLFEWTGSGSGDSAVYTWVSNNGAVTHIAPNSKLHFPFQGGFGERICLDYGNPNVGTALAWTWRKMSKAFGCNSGVYVDEENNLYQISPEHLVCYAYFVPFYDPTTGGTNWIFGNPRLPSTTLRKPWPAGWTQAQCMDSLRKQRSVWMTAAYNYLNLQGMQYIPNYDGCMSPGVNTSVTDNYNYEGRHIIAAYTKGANFGEGSNYNPSGNGFEYNVTHLVQACSDMRDSASFLYIDPLYVDHSDTRTMMNGLGLMLDCLFPGTTTYKFGPTDINAAVNDWHPSDTLTWSNAWGKYFGYPRIVRDTSQFGSNDGAGQSYVIHKITLASHNGASDTLTFAVGRYCRGANTSAASAVSVNLPSGTWWLLNNDGSYSLASSPITVRNAEWKVYTSNTAYSDNGFADNTPPVISVIDSSVTANVVTITWTTDDQATDTLEYGTTLSYGSKAGHSSRGTSHSITVTVAPSTHYHFRCRSTSDGGSTVSSDLTFTSLAADIIPPGISNISVTPGPNGAVITWTTNEPATSAVDYGLTNGYGSTSSDGTLVVSHSRTISGLDPLTVYHFRVVSSDASNNESVSTDQTFTTTSSGQQNNNGKKRIQRMVQ